jgi:hypothetical protein
MIKEHNGLEALPIHTNDFFWEERGLSERQNRWRALSILMDAFLGMEIEWMESVLHLLKKIL